MQFTDAVTVAGNAPDRRGYLIVKAKAVRTGIQLSLGDEVGKPDLRVVRVDRPAKEVFSDNGLQSFTHAPVTDNHPDEVVNAGNLSKQTELADLTQLFSVSSPGLRPWLKIP